MTLRIKHTLLALLLLITVVPSMAQASNLDGLTFMTEQYPPYNYEQDGSLMGIATDLVVEVFKQAGSSKTISNIQLLPWAKGYNDLQSKKDVCLFSTTRSKARESLFKWVGPISPTRTAIIAKKSRGLKIGSKAELGKYKYGVIRDDIGMQMLAEHGVAESSMDITGKNEANIKKLNAGRIDAWAYEESSAMYQLKMAGFSPSDYETVFVLNEADLYYAFNKEADDAVIAEFQQALDAVKASGALEKIRAKYLK